MNSRFARLAELLILFILVPTLMAERILPRRPLLVLNIAAILVYVVLRTEGISLFGRGSAREVIRRFLILAPPFAIFSFFFLSERFLSFPRERPVFWLIVCLLYPILSVLSQEVLFRTWFWHRYRGLFTSEHVMILTSSILFSYAHIVLNNFFVLVLCFFGGLLFSWTYSQRRSLYEVWLEHSLWGVLLFTLGWGRYLYHAAR